MNRKKLISFLVEHWPPITIVLFVFGLHYDIALFAIPATGDHMIHLYRGWLMAEQIIPSGRLTGWSNMAFAGDPAGVYYPILGDLLIAAFRYVTFGLLSWERTYAIAFFLLLVAMPLSVYAIARRAAGQPTALVAAVLAMGDVGGWPQGGHFSTVLWAVWPFMLGLTITWFSVLPCERVLQRSIKESPGRFLGFAVLLALGLLAHPMSAFFLGGTMPLFVLMYAVAHRREQRFAHMVGRAAAAGALGLVMALFWIVPWITTGNEWTHGFPAVGFGGLWYSLPEMFSRLIENDVFKNFYWVTWALGLGGVVLGLASRRLWPTFLAILLIIAFVGSGLCYNLGDGVIARKVQIERMAAFMKFIWFVLAGYTVEQVGKAAAAGAARLPERVRANALWRRGFSAIKIAALPLLVLFIVLVGWDDSYGKVRQIGRLGGPMWQDIVQAETWLGERPMEGPLERVLYQPGKLCIEGNLSSADCDEVYHRHIFASGPTRTKRPKIKFGYEATAIFRNLPLRHRWPADTLLIKRMLTEPEALKNLHVRWIISVVPWPRRPDLEEVQRFGDVHIYGVTSGKGPPVWLDGQGELEVLRFSDENVAVKVRGASPGARILYPIAHYYPWHAYHDGRPLKISTHGALPNVHEILMDVPAKDGVTELRYERPAIERASNRVSLVSWILVLGATAAVAVRRVRRVRRGKTG